MDDISGVVSQILSDPEQMQQIMDLAKNLSAGSGTDGAMLSPERMEEIGKYLQKSEAVDRKQEALVHALRPFLRPSRQSKLDRAMQIARLSHIAGIALKKDLIP